MSEALVPLLALVVKSTLIVVVAGALVAALKALRIEAAARHSVWLAAFAAIAVLPVAAAVLPGFAVVLPYSALGIATPDLSAPGAHVPERGWMAWVWSAYALGAGFMLARLAAARLSLTNLWRRAHAYEGACDIGELARACGARGEIEVRVSDAPVAPLTWGARVLLPPDAVNWPAARARDVLLHELSHVARRDSLTQILAAIVRALFWFSPAVWFALRGLRIEQEHACDERVLARGAEAVGYAQTLLDVAAGVRQPSLGMGVSTAMARASNLEQRVVAVLAPARLRRLSLMQTAVLGAALFASSAALAVARPVALVLGPLPPMTTTLAPLTRLPPLTERIDVPEEHPSSDPAR